MPAPGTSFPCGGPVGTSSASMAHIRQAGHWELTSWRRSPIAEKHTPCCELASVFRRDVLMIQTKLALLSSKGRHKSFTNYIYSYKVYILISNDNDGSTYYPHGHSNIAQGH